MKRIVAFSVLLVIFFGCVTDNTELINVRKERDELAVQVNADAALIQVLRDSVTMLSFPADQHLTKINKLVSSKELYGGYARDFSSYGSFPRIERGSIYACVY